MWIERYAPGILPEDDKHPPRPDVPVLNNLTFTEAHAIELGVYVGVVFGWGIVLGQTSAVFGLAMFIIRRMTSRRKVAKGKTNSDHAMGLHDAFVEPHYFGFAAVKTALFVVAIASVSGFA